jgi:hypothetical protein
MPLSSELFMDIKVSHHRRDETLEAKARWFQSLSLEERIDLLNSFTDIILEANPKIMEQKRAQPVAGRVCVLTIASSDEANTV